MIICELHFIHIKLSVQDLDLIRRVYSKICVNIRCINMCWKKFDAILDKFNKANFIFIGII